MSKTLLFSIVMSLFVFQSFSQNEVEVQGNLKVLQMNKMNSADSVVVRLNDGTLGVRDVNTLHNHYVGELFGGGIVFFVYDNGQHGLIAGLDDIDGGDGIQWYNGENIDCGADNHFVGSSNNDSIVIHQGIGSYAAYICDTLTAGGFSDWYLPSVYELKKLFDNALIIDQVLTNDGNPNSNKLHPEDVSPTSGFYWSSTETVGGAYAYSFYPWYGFRYDKSKLNRVRPIRKF